MNRITLIGNLTRDPDYTVTAAGVPVCRFDLAVNRRFKKDGETSTDYFRVVTFNKMAESCGTYLAKGRKAAVVGELRFSKYTDKQGTERMTHDVFADEVEFLSPKETPKEKTTLEEVTGDNLPF